MENTNQSQSGQGCRVKKSYPKWEAEKQYESIVSLERLAKAKGIEEGYVGV